MRRLADSGTVSPYSYRCRTLHSRPMLSVSEICELLVSIELFPGHRPKLHVCRAMLAKFGNDARCVRRTDFQFE